MPVTLKEVELWANAHKVELVAKEEWDDAVVIMRKYQKIEQAYSAYLETMNPETLADLVSTII